MEKSDALSLLNKYKDRPIEVAVNGGGDFMVYTNIEGNWLFTDDNGIVAVKKNVPNGRFDIGATSQREKPFTIVHVPYEFITCIKTFIDKEKGEIKKDIESLTPAGTSKSINDIIKEMEGDSIRRSNSPMGYTNNDGKYEGFKGSYISTNGPLPSNIENLVNN